MELLKKLYYWDNFEDSVFYGSFRDRSWPLKIDSSNVLIEGTQLLLEGTSVRMLLPGFGLFWMVLMVGKQKC